MQETLTKLLLAPVSVEVDPELAADVIFHTRIFFVVKTVKGTAHHGVDLKIDKTCDLYSDCVIKVNTKA